VDESGLIAELRRELGLGGATARVCRGGLLASAAEATAQSRLPLLSWGDFWALPLLREASASGVEVILGGDGGDELFGARAYLLADEVRGGHPLRASAHARELPGTAGIGRREGARILAQFGLAGALPYILHAPAQRLLERRRAPAWLRTPVRDELLASEDPLAWKRLDGPRWWAEAAYGLTSGIEEVGVFEHQRLRAASAGLEARHPLFDLELAETCLRQPPLATFDRRLSRPVFREAMAGLLPEAVRLRPHKTLFDALLIDSVCGRDGELARRLLGAGDAEIVAYVDPKALERELFDPAHGLPERSFLRMCLIWRMATAELWLRGESGGAGAVLAAAAQAEPARLQLNRNSIPLQAFSRSSEAGREP
jgi:hypothetical protein